MWMMHSSENSITNLSIHDYQNFLYNSKLLWRFLRLPNSPMGISAGLSTIWGCILLTTPSKHSLLAQCRISVLSELFYLFLHGFELQLYELQMYCSSNWLRQRGQHASSQRAYQDACSGFWVRRFMGCIWHCWGWCHMFFWLTYIIYTCGSHSLAIHKMTSWELTSMSSYPWIFFTNSSKGPSRTTSSSGSPLISRRRTPMHKQRLFWQILIKGVYSKPMSDVWFTDFFQQDCYCAFVCRSI